MYRDDPLDDEVELRAIIGDDEVDALLAAREDAASDPLAECLDILRVLQGWVDDRAAGAWLTQPQRRLDGATPIGALCDGLSDEVADAARAWTAAQG